MLLRFDTIARSSDFEQLAATMHLRPWQWRVLHAIDGRTPLDRVAAACGLDAETVVDLAVETEALGLVTIVTQTLEEYRSTEADVQPSLVAHETPASEPPKYDAWVATPAPASDPEPDLPVTDDAGPPPAGPTKRVSVSFDSLSPMFADTTAAEIPAAPTASLDDFSWGEPSVVGSGHDALPDVAHEASDELDASHASHAALPEDAPFAPEHGEAPVASEPPKKSVSFSLFAPTFGMPTTSPSADPEPQTSRFDEFASFDAASYRNGSSTDEFSPSAETPSAVSTPPTPPAVAEPTAGEANPTPSHPTEPTPATAPQSDILLQHYGAGPAPAASGADDDALKENGDLTGSLLRALGLKK